MPTGYSPNQIAGISVLGSGNTRTTGIYEIEGAPSLFTWVFGYWFLQNYFGTFDNEAYGYEEHLGIRLAQSTSTHYQGDTTYGSQSYNPNVGIYIFFPTATSVQLTINSNYSTTLKGIGSSTNNSLSFNSVYWHPYISITVLCYS